MDESFVAEDPTAEGFHSFARVLQFDEGNDLIEPTVLAGFFEADRDVSDLFLGWFIELFEDEGLFFTWDGGDEFSGESLDVGDFSIWERKEEFDFDVRRSLWDGEFGRAFRFGGGESRFVVENDLEILHGEADVDGLKARFPFDDGTNFEGVLFGVDERFDRGDFDRFDTEGATVTGAELAEKDRGFTGFQGDALIGSAVQIDVEAPFIENFIEGFPEGEIFDVEFDDFVRNIVVGDRVAGLIGDGLEGSNEGHGPLDSDFGGGD